MKISQAELPVILAAIKSAVNEHGHPDDIPLGTLEQLGVSAPSAELCMMLLTEEDFPSDPAGAVAKWVRQIGELIR